jgi:transcriptional regulator with GAF, ATPase, and Fis domain
VPSPADEDHSGWFETCSEHGTVFLDEIGELNNDIQVKLLRVLQSREFSRVGETTTRRFAGKVIAATNRELRWEKRAGRFRGDLFYRICGDMVRTPTLREQLADAPEDWPHLVRIAASRVAGPKTLDRVATAAENWASTHLRREYAWPGNMRELEQCVRNILNHEQYEADDEADAPLAASAPRDASDALLAGVRQGTLTAAELLQGYCARVYARTGSYEETGRRLDLHWQTVRTNVRAWAQRMRG